MNESQCEHELVDEVLKNYGPSILENIEKTKLKNSVGIEDCIVLYDHYPDGRKDVSVNERNVLRTHLSASEKNIPEYKEAWDRLLNTRRKQGSCLCVFYQYGTESHAMTSCFVSEIDGKLSADWLSL